MESVWSQPIVGKQRAVLRAKMLCNQGVIIILFINLVFRVFSIMKRPLFLVSILIFASLCWAKSDSDRDFKLTVIVLTMDRPHSLARLLRSIYNTDFESKEDFFDIEIHVDKTVGLHYQECVE